MESQKEKLLEKNYDRVVNVGFCLVPYQDLSEMISPDVFVFGTTKDEQVFSLNELINFLHSQYQQMKDFEPSLTRNRLYTRISKDHNTASIAEEITLTLTSDEIINDIYMRTSCVMEYSDNDWKLTHWHASTPVDTENDHWHMEEWKREKEKLQKLVDQQTADLRNKNQELEIEAALERVRTVAMGMKKPEDMLDICRIISDQLQQFGATNIRNIQTAIIDEQKGIYLCYQYFTPYDKETVEQTEYIKNPVEHEMVRQMLASKNGHFTGSLTKNELEDFREHRKAENHFPDPLLDEAEEVSYCFLSIGQGGLGLTLYQPLNPTILSIFQRFHQVFNLAYQRFRDIELAQSQAREAQIETALERVRARTMAMHNSEELKEIIREVYDQFAQLKINVEHAGFILDYKERDDMHIWLADHQQGVPYKISIPYFDSPHWNSYQEAKAKGENFFTNLLDFDEKNKFYNELIELIPPVPKETIQSILDKPGLTISTVLLENVGLYIENYSGVAFSAEDNFLLMRFGKVFQQAYTRFLDLQKAELQAREARVNLAVERVRAKALAMFKSEEILEVVYKLKEEIMGLNIPNVSAATIHLKEPDGMYRAWDLTSIDETGKELEISLDLSYHMEDTHPDFFMREVWTRTEEYFVVIQDRERTRHTVQWLQQNGYPKQAKDFEEFLETSQLERAYHPTVPLNNGRMCIDLLEPPVPEVKDILKKMAGAFDLAYKRFEDLQNAEEQAREAKIELSLERIRAQVTAMQQSSDLFDIVVSMRHEFLSLGHKADYFWHMQWLEGSYDMSMTSEAGDRIGMVIHIPGFVHEEIPGLAEWEKSDKPTYVLALDAEGAWDYIENMNTHGQYELADPHAPTREDIEQIGGLTFIMARTTHGEIGYSLPGVVPSPPKNAVDTLVRFAGVFDLAYKRFEDLQKAEARARETQIELALERVRAKTMAMQQSHDLLDLVVSLRTEFVNLGHNAQYFWHMRWLPEKYEKAMTSGDGSRIGMVMTLPRHIHGDIEELAAWEKSRESTYVLAMDVDTAVDYVDKMISLGDFEQLDPQAPTLDDIRHIGGLTFVMARTTHGEIGYSLPGVVSSPPKDAVDNLVRFAGVFDLAYKRFEDLQKAEARARENHIELALERVRARTMAMQKSEELANVAFVLFEQLRALGGNLWGTGFGLCDNDIDQDTFWFANENGIFPPVSIPNTTDPAHKRMFEGWQANKVFLTLEASGKELKSHYNYMMTLPEVRPFFQKILDEGLSFPDWQQWNAAYFKHGYLLIITLDPYPDPDILIRFAKVFNQTYTRFLDLKNAEAQAREAEIQLALERVRARSMAMQKSEELADLSLELVKQVQALGVATWFCAFNIYDEHPQGSLEWGSNGQGTFPEYRTPREGIFLRYYEAGQRGETLLINEIDEEECPAHYEYLCSLPGVGDQLLKIKSQGIPFPTSQIDHVAFFKYGYIIFITFEPAQKAHNIFKRFARVFEQTYTRFLDLQKAEAQTREAKIETGLERVRSRTMGMQSSEELPEVANLLFLEIQALGIPAWSCGYNILAEDKKTATCCMSSEGTLQEPFKLRLYGEKSFDEMGKFLSNGKDMLVQELGDAAIGDHYAYMKSFPDLQPTFDAIEAEGLSLPTYQINHLCKFSHGFLLFITYKPVPDAHDIFKRYTKVFDQTYTRFLDLKKAEAQAREAQIEAALERVRSRTIGMQYSTELQDAAVQMFDQIQNLGLTLIGCGFNIWNEDKSSATAWMSGLNRIQQPFKTSSSRDIFLRIYQASEKGELFFSEKQEGKQLEDHYQYMASIPEFRIILNNLFEKGISIPAVQVMHCAFFAQGYLMFLTPEVCHEAHGIFKRFAKVFEQTYTRFLDLQKAEAQAREAHIGSALEKVRSRSLAMQSPNELNEVVQLLREEMGNLGVEELETSSIYINEEQSGFTQCWFTIKDTEDHNKTVTDKMIINLKDTWVGGKMEEFCHSDHDTTSILMKGRQREEWIRYCEERSPLFGNSNFYGEAIPERTYHLCKFSNGFLGAASSGEISNESWDLIKRATGVFSFAYTRFRDLQKAEESARRSKQQASLDRVRADISSMRTADDLNRITPLIWRELTTLDIPFIRCGVFIIHEEEQKVEVYLSKPNGRSLAVMHLPFGSNELVVQTVKSWKDNSVYKQSWTKEEFLKWGQLMMAQNQVQDLETYQGAENPPESLNLHFIPFTQGMLYVGSNDPLDHEEIELAGSLAKAFSIAYARYEDFVKLEKAKAGIEEALTELKATQSQLIQQEKLASLGQLTAGIAHEIKNPLNFVNNFSDLSVELIEETKEALSALSDQLSAEDQERITEASEILQNIEVNLQKIHEHGSRADSIVRSMLEHSRGGTGIKEPTDLNSLVKEFVNLTFHGMRAGKDPMNVDIIYELDQNTGAVPLVAEDFSRVIVNLCNNAFDAMREKRLIQKSLSRIQNYSPKLSVRTKLVGGKIYLEIEDNGPGIPQEIKNKILQPFFTTKKGTQGTGLGLSITNDIIKAHGGALELHSTADRGTIFTIILAT